LTLVADDMSGWRHVRSRPPRALTRATGRAP
jgi:hypothetical protein